MKLLLLRLYLLTTVAFYLYTAAVILKFLIAFSVVFWKYGFPDPFQIITLGADPLARLLIAFGVRCLIRYVYSIYSLRTA
jgi:hypothetical protein